MSACNGSKGRQDNSGWFFHRGCSKVRQHCLDADASGCAVLQQCCTCSPLASAVDKEVRCAGGTRAAVVAAPPMDLASFPSVAAFAAAFAEQLRDEPLHVLINNAGANFMGQDPWHTSAGVAGIPQVPAPPCRATHPSTHQATFTCTKIPETIFDWGDLLPAPHGGLWLQVNVLGPFALTQRLRPLLEAAGQEARLVAVASVMHRRATLPSDLHSFFTLNPPPPPPPPPPRGGTVGLPHPIGSGQQPKP